MNSNLINNTTKLIAVFLLTALFSGCNDHDGHHDHDHSAHSNHGDHSEHDEHDDHDENKVYTEIADNIAQNAGIKTSVAQSVVMPVTIPVYGVVTENAQQTRQIKARFEGVIKSVLVSQGDKVVKGQKLATVESNESLQLIPVTSPINGVVKFRNTNKGEQTAGKTLFTIMDNRSVWVELAVFPTDLEKVSLGNKVTIKNTLGSQTAQGTVSFINYQAEPDQSVKVRVVLDNTQTKFHLGHHVSAEIKVAEHLAKLAVKRTALQNFRDFTVVFAKIGERYEPRMLELGLISGEWAEVLGGLKAETVYVSENSYVIKADIEKEGAAHDH